MAANPAVMRQILMQALQRRGMGQPTPGPGMTPSGMPLGAPGRFPTPSPQLPPPGAQPGVIQTGMPRPVNAPPMSGAPGFPQPVNANPGQPNLMAGGVPTRW